MSEKTNPRIMPRGPLSVDEMSGGRTCIECGNEFTVSEGEVSFLIEKGLKVYRRCSQCRRPRRALAAN